MAAARIDGTAIAKKIRERLRTEILERQKTNPRFQPSLKIIQGVLLNELKMAGQSKAGADSELFSG